MKVQKSRGYPSGLAWVRFNQKLAFYHSDMISKSSISPATPDDSAIHRRPYYDMQCDAMQCKDIINQLQS